MNVKRTTGFISLLILISAFGISAYGQDNENRDPFGGRLFAPNFVLRYQDELNLTDAQRRQIRELVISTQTEISENQWDMREAYRDVIAELDEATIDVDATTELLHGVLETENRVKLAQVMMLIRLRNLLTAEQVSILRAARREE